MPPARMALLAAVLLLLVPATGCSRPRHADPAAALVRDGNVTVVLEPSFHSTLDRLGVRVDWSPPACSWRLRPPACGGPTAAGPTQVAMPVVGGTVTSWPDQPRLRGRVELAGELVVRTTALAFPVDDLTFDPGTSTISGNTPVGPLAVLFVDGTNANIVTESDAVSVDRADIKLLPLLTAALASQLRIPTLPDYTPIGTCSFHLLTRGRA
jgi:hypothetical protein